MTFKKLLILLIAALVLSAGTSAAQQQETVPAEIQTAINAAKDKREEALLRKKLGDWYAAREDNAHAAEEYVKAMRLEPAAFTDQEQFRMATVISWTDQKSEAVGILRSLLERSPKNREARLQLARVLSWQGKLSDAGAEADTLLAANPDDQEALIVKANILRWSGNAEASKPLYQKALALSENFDARIGLGYAYLAAGDLRTARNTVGQATPAYPYQEKELATFYTTASEQQQFWVGTDYTYYHDSDENRTNRYGIWFGTRIGRWDTELAYRVADAHDPRRQEKAEELRLIGRGRIGAAGIRASAGIAETESNGPRFGIGQISGSKDLGATSIWAGVSRDLFTDTAELIQNRIMRTSGTISISQKLASSFVLQGAYTHSSYSDDNSSNDLRLTVRYPFTVSVYRMSTGYQFRYWDFEKETRSGYFDPRQFISHQLFVSLSWEKGRWYATFDPYFGYQSFTRYAKNTHEFYGGFSGAAGWRVKQRTSIELYTEGGNYAGGTTAGYNYYLAGIRAVLGL